MTSVGQAHARCAVRPEAGLARGPYRTAPLFDPGPAEREPSNSRPRQAPGPSEQGDAVGFHRALHACWCVVAGNVPQRPRGPDRPGNVWTPARRRAESALLACGAAERRSVLKATPVTPGLWRVEGRSAVTSPIGDARTKTASRCGRRRDSARMSLIEAPTASDCTAGARAPCAQASCGATVPRTLGAYRKNASL